MDFLYTVVFRATIPCKKNIERNFSFYTHGEEHAIKMVRALPKMNWNSPVREGILEKLGYRANEPNVKIKGLRLYAWDCFLGNHHSCQEVKIE